MLPVKSNLRPTVSKFFEDDWNSLFDWTNRSYSGNLMPSTNIKETSDQYVVEVAAPGLKKEDFSIQLDNNVLTIKSEIKTEMESSNDEQYSLKEFGYQSFTRSFNLNNKVVDDSKIKATYQDGILSLILPKKEEAKQKPARNIKIS